MAAQHKQQVDEDDSILSYRRSKCITNQLSDVDSYKHAVIWSNSFTNSPLSLSSATNQHHSSHNSADDNTIAMGGSSNNDVPKKDDSKKQTWENNFNEVLKFAKENGHLNIPSKPPKMRRLAGWLRRQKYRTHRTNKQLEKLATLKPYGYSEDSCRKDKEEAKWTTNFNDLVKFMEMDKSLVVSKTAFPTLAQWVANQRKMEKQNRLDESRKRRLLEIGFDFHPYQGRKKKLRFTEEQQIKWDEMYHQLCVFKEKYGHCCVVYNDKEFVTLSQWVSTQRAIYNRGEMDESRSQKLNDIAFSWSLRHHG